MQRNESFGQENLLQGSGQYPGYTRTKRSQVMVYNYKEKRQFDKKYAHIGLRNRYVQEYQLLLWATILFQAATKRQELSEVASKEIPTT